ncbi:MAG: cation-translocating P-type ATPase [Candidatus Fermentithermobacillus carboniphilus]|uniref:Cd(2+)-exporting ATPase n=1 Tax=Candidatus Fermentithermobacillus carboniphilus TaxID=3085328 RepID=A0AAT9LB89_9FIRM|nr:MAG: cation-translocating P-type ATPase [Candidatus Fermentithermobacillus carboniphilus]
MDADETRESGKRPGYNHGLKHGLCSSDTAQNARACGLSAGCRSDPHSNSHSHSYCHPHTGSCGSDEDTTWGDEEEEGGISEFLPSLLGITGIALGFILRRMGYSAYRIPFFMASVFAGYPVARAGIRALLAGRGADINLLTTIAGIGAMMLGEWAEGAAVLTLFSIGEYLEDKAGERTRKSIRELMDLAPATARVKREGGFEEVPFHDVVPGDVVVVLPGERISVDGNVLSGESSVNEAPITGESVPVDKSAGSQVFAGTLNGEGALEIVATKGARDTTLSRIIAMVEEAQSRQAKSQRLVDAFARYWTPAMLALSVLVAIGVPLVSGQAFRPWIYRGLTILIVSCPCSLVISTPVTVVAAIARAARGGVLIKGGIHLEELGQVKAVAFDKTGTVTLGRMTVEDVVRTKGRVVSEREDDVGSEKEPEAGETDGQQNCDPGGERDERAVLAIAAAVESRSEHPLARAVVEAARLRGVEFTPGEGFFAVRGRGARASVGGEEAFVGSEELFRDEGIPVPEDLVKLGDDMRASGKTVVFVGTRKGVSGMLGISDSVRPEAREALGKLREKGLELVMLTGDDRRTAETVATRLGLTKFLSNLLPEDKVHAIQRLKYEVGPVAMVGDGVNDAPSLAEATVGIAMGRGTDIALEAADVTLMRNDLNAIPWAIDLARKARALIIQNVAFSIAVKVLALVLVFGGILPLWVAVMADSGASVAVTLNGLRILRHS